MYDYNDWMFIIPVWKLSVIGYQRYLYENYNEKYYIKNSTHYKTLVSHWEFS